MNDNVSSAFDRLMSIILPIYDRTCPLTLVKLEKCEPRKSWIIKEIVEASALNNTLYENYLNTGCESMLRDFKVARNHVNSQRWKAKKEYFANKLSHSNDNSKNTWMGINEIIEKKQQLQTNSLSIGGEFVNDEFIIADLFGKYFANIGKDIQAEGLSNSKTDFSDQEFTDYRGSVFELKFEPCDDLFIPHDFRLLWV